ncbi:MAG: hypothetical protein ACJA1N_000235 [Saprospiraceae bacterium]|jgi:hypothetical protein
MVKLSTRGKIVKGDQQGWYVLVEVDEKTGGFYIYQFKNKNGKNNLGEAFDDWVETFNDVEGYFKESSWKINWE